ncbi:hypothetical protein E3E36_06225 [Thermococcus sp. M36]|nr:hypothetical protein [Thermococcus sp. M36]NJE05744.1 hypothetical protein [Thermococcus sp. M36]
MVVYPLVLGVPLFAFIWIKHGGVTREWVLEMVFLSILTFVSTVFFLARILEKHGYSKRDIKRLFEILEEHWDEPWYSGYLKHDVQYCIAYHLVFWGFLSVALLEFQDVSLVITAFAGMVFLLVMVYPIASTMVVWILALPFYFLGDDRAEDAFEFIGKTSLASTLAIPAIWVVSGYFATQNYPKEILDMFNAVVGNAGKFLALSLINTLFGFLGVYLPRRVGRRILSIVLLSLAVAMLFILWELFKL